MRSSGGGIGGAVWQALWWVQERAYTHEPGPVGNLGLGVNVICIHIKISSCFSTKIFSGDPHSICVHIHWCCDVKVFVDDSDVDRVYEDQNVKSKEEGESGQIIKSCTGLGRG
ncbi:hypothetical protein Tco_0428730 [Tanacetum coccineum]